MSQPSNVSPRGGNGVEKISLTQDDKLILLVPYIVVLIYGLIVMGAFSLVHVQHPKVGLAYISLIFLTFQMVLTVSMIDGLHDDDVVLPP